MIKRVDTSKSLSDIAYKSNLSLLVMSELSSDRSLVAAGLGSSGTARRDRAVVGLAERSGATVCCR